MTNFVNYYLSTLQFFLSNKERSEEHTSELQSPSNLVCRLLLEKKKSALTRSGTSYVRLRSSAKCSDSTSSTDARPSTTSTRAPRCSSTSRSRSDSYTTARTSCSRSKNSSP